MLWFSSRSRRRSRTSGRTCRAARRARASSATGTRAPAAATRRREAADARMTTLSAMLLALQVDELLQDLVRRGDDAGVGLEAALGDDHVGELERQVDVRHLERARGHRAQAVRVGVAPDDVAAVRGTGRVRGVEDAGV